MENQPNHVGYGPHPPNVHWPNNAKICISFVINYESGGELNILNGDNKSENYLCEIPETQSIINGRNLAIESCWEYGSRVGIYRLLNLFKKHNISCTIFAVAKALEKNPDICRILVDYGHEIASHHYRWFNYRNLSYEQELQHLRKAIKTHADLFHNTGQEFPKGLYVGSLTKNSRRILHQINSELNSNGNDSCFEYTSDAYNDDIPYYLDGNGNNSDGNLLCIPYSLDSNDMRFLISNGYVTSEQFFQYLCNAFQVLFEEGGKMMSVGLHCRISGHPGRFRAIQKFLQYLEPFRDRIWIATRLQISQFWKKNYPPKNQMLSKSKL